MSIITIPLHLYPNIVVKPLTSASTSTLDAVDEFVFYVIEIPKTGTLNKIGWHTGTVTPGTSYTLKVSVETVAEVIGQPVAITNAGKTLFASGSESADITAGLTTNGYYFTAINGPSGISVTAGDLVAITIRMLAVNGASINVGRYNASYVITPTMGVGQYSGSYVNSAWSVVQYCPSLNLEYGSEFVPLPYITPLLGDVYNAWNSSSNPDRRGVKFKIPYSCRIYGCQFQADFASDVDIIMYDSDGYTVITGFPIAMKQAKRRTTSVNTQYFVFPTKVTIQANTYYRIVALPKSATNISYVLTSLIDDGSVLGKTAFYESDDFSYTTFNGVPSSGSHAWTDTPTNKVAFQLLIDGIEASAGTAGATSFAY